MGSVQVTIIYIIIVNQLSSSYHDTGNQPSKWGPVSVVDTLLVPENIPAGKWVAMMVNDNNMMR